MRAGTLGGNGCLVLSSPVFGLSRTLGAPAPPCVSRVLRFAGISGSVQVGGGPSPPVVRESRYSARFLSSYLAPASNRIDRSSWRNGCRCLRNEGFRDYFGSLGIGKS